MCNVKQSADWVTFLPTILLGLRTTYKEDIKCSAAELMYGTTLRIPGEFFEDVDHPVTPELFVQELREKMRSIRARPTAHHVKKTLFIHKALEQATHVFVRDDMCRRPLQPPYQGPFEVLARVSERLYTILMKGKPHNLSVERLKPAFLPAEEVNKDSNLNIPTPTPLRTYSGPKSGAAKSVKFQGV